MLQAIAIASLGILRCGIYGLFYPLSDRKESCLLGVSADFDDYGDRTFVTRPEVCRLGMAVAYLSMIVGLVMFCDEGLKKGRNAVTSWEGRSPATKLLFAMAMCLLWACSFALATWGWVVTSSTYQNLGNTNSNMKVQALIYITFQVFSSVIWVSMYRHLATSELGLFHCGVLLWVYWDRDVLPWSLYEDGSSSRRLEVVWSG